MRTSKFSADQIVGILQEHEAGAGTGELCRATGALRFLRAARLPPRRDRPGVGAVPGGARR